MTNPSTDVQTKHDMMLVELSKSQTLEEIAELFELSHEEILSRAARLGLSIIRHQDTIEHIAIWSTRQTKGTKMLSLREAKRELERAALAWRRLRQDCQ